MSQTTHLVDTLKRCLRAKGLTYCDLADALGLSESSIKRLFSEKTFSLQRFEEVCRYLDMSVYDLARLAATHDDRRVDLLTDEQETALAEDPVLLTFYYLLLIGWKPRRIAKRLKLDEPGQTLCLTRLDRLKLIELMPRNRVRLLTDSRISWSVTGPVRRRYESQVKREFVGVAFDDADEKLTLEVNELSDASIKVLLRRIDGLVEEFTELAEIDRGLPREQKHSFGLLLAAREWTFWNIVGELPTMK